MPTLRRLLAWCVLLLAPVGGKLNCAPRLSPPTPGCWEADTGYFTPQKRRFLVNTAFIATDEGVVVIGSGPSRQFGERYRKLD